MRQKRKMSEIQETIAINGRPLSLLLLLLLLFLAHPSTILPLSYSLNTTALDGIWHRAAVMALLRLQAKLVISELKLSMMERIVFSECEREAQKVVEMAKCVAKLLRKRGRMEAEANEEEERRRRIKWTEEREEGEERKREEEGETEREGKWTEKREEGEERKREEEGETDGEEKWRREKLAKEKLRNIWKGPFGTGKRASNKKNQLKIRLMNKVEGVNSFYTVRRRRRDTVGQRFAHHMDNLNELQRFWEIRKFCEEYLARLTERNAKFLRSQLPFHVNFRVNNLMDRKTSNANVLQIDDISNQLTNFMQKVAKRKRGPLWRRLSIISPRLFSLPFSSRQERAQSKEDQLVDSLLLSPRLFSLSPNDGLFALPDLFNNQRKMIGKKYWINAILEISGAGKAIRKALDGLEEEKRRLEERVFPTVLDLERRDRQWKDLLDDEQKRKMEQHGFAFLTKEQAKLIYGNKEVTDAEFLALNSHQRQHRIEKAILELANLDEQNSEGEQKLKRKRRQIVIKNQTERISRSELGKNSEKGTDQRRETNSESEGEKKEERTERKEQTEHLKVLAPYAFANSVADGVALEATILSPSAFVSELISPVALSTQVLSPRAFIAAVLSPEALFARVLSPSVFFSDILSPRALTPFVLSPEAMFTEILSPRALEPRILSPEMGMVKVLSPEFLSPRVASPEQLAILILSPAILSPKILSRQKMVVEIISPHILSGGSDEMEGHEHEKQLQHGEGHKHGIDGEGH